MFHKILAVGQSCFQTKTTGLRNTVYFLPKKKKYLLWHNGQYSLRLRISHCMPIILLYITNITLAVFYIRKNTAVMQRFSLQKNQGYEILCISCQRKKHLPVFFFGARDGNRHRLLWSLSSMFLMKHLDKFDS